MYESLIVRLTTRGNRFLTLPGWEEYGKDMLEAAQALSLISEREEDQENSE